MMMMMLSDRCQQCRGRQSFSSTSVTFAIDGDDYDDNDVSDRCQQCRGRQSFSSTSVTNDVNDDDVFRQMPAVSRSTVFQ